MKPSNRLTVSPTVTSLSDPAKVFAGIKLEPLRGEDCLASLEPSRPDSPCDAGPARRIGYGDSVCHPDREADLIGATRPTVMEEIRYMAYMSSKYGINVGSDPYIGGCQ